MCHPHEASPDNGETTDNITYWRARRAELELRAVILLGVASATMSIVCGSIIVSGWFAGVLIDSWERVFWAGAVTAGVMIAVFAAAALPGGENARWACRRIGWLLRIGMLLFVLAPFLCILGLVGDFFSALITGLATPVSESRQALARLFSRGTVWPNVELLAL